tara:strand:+ start:3200 stop:3466 length:267 start_codon:yes stop_codon:yes gene_type:complete
VKENDIPEEDNRYTGDSESHKALELINKIGITDKILNKVISRKLLVFLTATGLFMWFGLDPDTWGLIAMMYVGGQSVIDTVKVWKHGG